MAYKDSSERLVNEDKAPCPRALLRSRGLNQGPPVWKSEALTARPRQLLINMNTSLTYLQEVGRYAPFAPPPPPRSAYGAFYGTIIDKLGVKFCKAAISVPASPSPSYNHQFQLMFSQILATKTPHLLVGRKLAQPAPYVHGEDGCTAVGHGCE